MPLIKKVLPMIDFVISYHQFIRYALRCAKLFTLQFFHSYRNNYYFILNDQCVWCNIIILFKINSVRYLKYTPMWLAKHLPKPQSWVAYSLEWHENAGNVKLAFFSEIYCLNVWCRLTVKSCM